MRRTSDYSTERLRARNAEREQASATRYEILRALAPGADPHDLKYLARHMTGDLTFRTLCQVLVACQPSTED